MESGTILRLSYDMWLEGVDTLFDTTDKDRAEKSGIYDPKHKYAPIVVVTGAGRLVPGLEKAVQEKGKVGEWVEVGLSPSEGFGERDPKKIEQVPMQRFKASKVAPEVGARITFNNRPATITRIGGGRVWVDTNTPLAGRTVKYRFKVDEVVTDTAAKVNALLEADYRPGLAWGVKVDGKTVEITAPELVKYDRDWGVAKFRLAQDLGKYAALKTVRFIEEFATDKPMATGQGGHFHPDGSWHEGDHGEEAAHAGHAGHEHAKTEQAHAST